MNCAGAAKRFVGRFVHVVPETKGHTDGDRRVALAERFAKNPDRAKTYSLKTSQKAILQGKRLAFKPIYTIRTFNIKGRENALRAIVEASIKVAGIVRTSRTPQAPRRANNVADPEEPRVAANRR